MGILELCGVGFLSTMFNRSFRNGFHHLLDFSLGLYRPCSSCFLTSRANVSLASRSEGQSTNNFAKASDIRWHSRVCLLASCFPSFWRTTPALHTLADNENVCCILNSVVDPLVGKFRGREVRHTNIQNKASALRVIGFHRITVSSGPCLHVVFFNLHSGGYEL